MTKFQNYSHYKLPITMEPLEYGKLIEQFGNKYIVQLNTNNVFVIVEKQNENYIKLFRKGELMFEFKDVKKSEFSFVRIIADQRYTFEKNKLISTEILSSVSNIKIYPLYEDTNALTLKNITPFKFNIDFIFDWIDNSKDPLKAFLIWELCIILVFYIIFVILPDQFLNIDNNLTLASMSAGNIIKLRRVVSKNVWNEFILKVNNKIFTKDLFEKLFNKFWLRIEENFTNVNHMFILLKIKYNNGEIVSIGKLQRLNLRDKQWYIDFIIENMKFKSEYYNETQIVSFIFSYGFKDGKIKNKEIILNNSEINSMEHNKLNIPISMNPLDYGKIVKIIETSNGEIIFVQNIFDQIVIISKFNGFNEVEISKSGKTLIKFRDELISENKFERIIDNKKYLFENGEQFLLTKDMKSKFISKLSTSKNFNNKFITLDIETFIKDSILIVYCISIFDGNFKKSFFRNDFKNVDELIITALKSIMVRKYNKTNVYIHNMAKFDIIFLLKYLVKLGTIHPVFDKFYKQIFIVSLFFILTILLYF